MTAADGDALLAAIHADPDDDAARAVYGDWLLQRGDPRGELVTLQLADARGTASTKDRRRIGALLRAHWPEWGTPLYGAIRLAESRFERGFLARVAVGLAGTTSERIAIMIGHPIWATVRHVSTPSRPPRSSELVVHPVMRSLRSLKLYADDVADVFGRNPPWTLDAFELSALPPQLGPALDALGDHPGCARARALTLTVPGGGVATTLARVTTSKFADRVDRLALHLYQYPGSRDDAIADAVIALSTDSPFRKLTVAIGHIEVTGMRGADGRRVELAIRRDGANEYAREYSDRFIAACGSRFACSLDD